MSQAMTEGLRTAIEAFLGTERPAMGNTNVGAIREWELAVQRLRIAYGAYQGHVEICPVPSSVTGQPCLLPVGHPQDSADRFHRYAAELGQRRRGVDRVLGAGVRA